MDKEETTSGKPEAASKKEKYRCKTKCFWNNTLWMEGDTVDVDAGTKMPEHFQKV